MGYSARWRGRRGWGGELRGARAAGGGDRGAAPAAGTREARRRGGDRDPRADHRSGAGRDDRDRAAGGRARGAGALIDDYLAGIVASGNDRLGEAVRYSLLSGGKRVRPRLCLAAAAGAGADPRLALPA